MNESGWHRRVSPIFMILLIVAGVAIAFIVYEALTVVGGPQG